MEIVCLLDMEVIQRTLGFLGKEVLTALMPDLHLVEVPAGTELVKEGQYIKVVPVVVSGLVKVFTRNEDKELLLYYIQPEQSCIMSFSSGTRGEKSKIYAVTEEPCELIVMPAAKISGWIQAYPELNQLFYRQYDLRYAELIETVQHLLYNKLDKRLLDYLHERVSVTGKNPIQITHREIAQDLGTAREVISRLLKRFEKQGQVRIVNDGIEVV